MWNAHTERGLRPDPCESETHPRFVHARADRAPIREPGPHPPMKDPRAPKPIEEPDADLPPIREPGVEVPRIEPPDQEQPPLIEPPEPTGSRHIRPNRRDEAATGRFDYPLVSIDEAEDRAVV